MPGGSSKLTFLGPFRRNRNMSIDPALETEPAEFFDPASGITYRLRPAVSPGRPGAILLHGYAGDEKVLWVIESALGMGGVIAAPRGLFPAGEGGYAWTEQHLGPGGRLEDFLPAVGPVGRWIATLEAEHGFKLSNAMVAGFSQGSALAFALAALGGFQPAGLIALAAYLPEGDLSRLAGLPIFWGHGTQDDRVPVERARQDAARLREAGADLSYCESDTGHKVGLACMRALQQWVADRQS
jgi:phospholipase/carboxylesterase